MPSPLDRSRGRRSNFARSLPFLLLLTLAALNGALTASASASPRATTRAGSGQSLATPIHTALRSLNERRSAVGESAARRASAAGPSTQPLGPGAIRRAYALPATGARAQKIAVITAYDDPYAEKDLNAYLSQYGLKSCTTRNHCFEKLNEQGKASPLPGADPTGGQWLTEASIGTQVARGLCTSCSIVLVEASGIGRADLSAAAGAAARAGATVVVSAYTIGENGQDDPLLASDFHHAKTAVVAAVGDPVGGDYGYFGAANFPSSLPDVLAVGGTQLNTVGGGTYRSESAWSGTVGGCSTFETAGSWQRADAAAVGCHTSRAVADISAMANPGAVVHITGNTEVGGGPWYAATGTSLSAPIIGAAIGLAGSLGDREAQVLYGRAKSDPGAFRDIRSGQDAASCSSAICRAGKGYDGPTGLGTPDGLAAFLPSGGALNRRHPGVSITAPRRTLRPSRSWRVTLTLRNANPFAVTGSVALQRGRGRSSVFASKAYRLAPLATGKLTLTVRRGGQRLLRRLHLSSLFAQLSARGPVRPTVRRTIAYGFRLP